MLVLAAIAGAVTAMAYRREPPAKTLVLTAAEWLELAEVVAGLGDRDARAVANKARSAAGFGDAAAADFSAAQWRTVVRAVVAVGDDRLRNPNTTP